MAGEPATDPWAEFNPRPPASPPASPDSGADPWAAFSPRPGSPPAASSAPATPQSGGVMDSIRSGLSRAAGAVSSAAGAVRDIVVGQNEFDYPEITADPPNGLDLQALALARGEGAMLDILKRDLPDLKVAKDKFGNTIVGTGGKAYYLNKSGLSGRDVDETLRDTLFTLPFGGVGGALTRGAALPIRAAVQGAAGAAGSLTSDVASLSAGSEQGVDVQALLASALGGAGGEMLGSLGAAVVNKIKNNPAKFVGPQGLTPEGEKIFAEAGLDVKDVSQRIADEFAKRARVTGPVPATAREAAASEFGVPLTRGLATGDFDQIAFENAAKAGARGEVAGAIVRDQYGRMNTAVENARADLAREFGPKVPDVNQYDAADVVRGGIRAREEAHGQMVDAAWQQAREMSKGAFVPKASITELPNIARDALRSDPRYYTPADAVAEYPKTLRAMDLFKKWGALDIGEITTKSGTGVTPQGVALELMDEFRKMLSGRGGLLSEATGGDKLRLGAIVKAFNGWMDGLVDDGLLKGGSPAAWQQFKNARAASAKHFALFNESNTLDSGVDKAGRVLERMVNEDVTSAEVANWLWGKGQMGEGGDAYRLAKRLGSIFPADSLEWDALRSGMSKRLTTQAEGKTQLGAQAMAQNILEFTNGKGRALAGVLFDADQLSKMRRFAATLKNTLPPADATNPSKSGYELARAIGGISTSTSALPVRLFLRFSDQTRNYGSTAKALTTGGGAPVVRTPASPLVPAASAAVAGQNFRGSEE